MNLEKRERRSSLKRTDAGGIKRCGGHVDQAKPKRRISFCGRKSVREFHTEEKPKSWNNSYEISDHLNISGTSPSGCKSAMMFGNSISYYKENSLNLESILSLSKYCHQTKNQTKAALKETNSERPSIGNIDLYSGEKDDIKPITSEDTYYGNENILRDDKFVSIVNQNRSLMESMEMDISKVHGNEAHRKNKLINDEEVEDITKNFNNQLTTHTFESRESVKNTGRRLSNIADESMDISMYLNENIKKSSRSNYSHLNSKGELQITTTTETSAPKVDVLRKVYSSSENLLTGTIPKIKGHQLLFGNSIIESGSYDQYTNNNSHLNIEAKLDIKSYENSSLRSISYNSPLFPPIKSKKLNLRQLNAEICDGKIVVFPNKIKQCILTNPNINATIETDFKDEAYINDISDINNKKDISKFSEYEDLTSDSTSFLVREKVDDETVLENVPKLSENGCKRDTIQFSSEIDTSTSKMELTALIIKDTSIENTNRVQNTIAINSSNCLLNTKESNASSIELMRSICDPLDMSLSSPNIETITNTPPKNIESVTIEACDETKHVTELDVTPQNNKSLYQQRQTIYFNQDIAPLKGDMRSVSGLCSYKIESKSSQDINLSEYNYNNNEFKCTPISKVTKCNEAVVMRRKALDFSDGSSDSLVLNLKEARAALSCNCERRLEGTPHRSFLEFVHLEKEVEHDDEISFDISIPDEQLRENEQQKQRSEMESLYKSSNINLSGLNPIETDNLHFSLISSPISDPFFYERSIATLTPNLPIPNKRQTLLFNDCPMDESINCSENESKNINIGSTNEYSFKKYTLQESIDKEVRNLNVIKTDEPIECNSISVEDIVLEKDTIQQPQLQIEASQVLKAQNENSPSVNTSQSRIPITSICNVKERKSISVNSSVTSKGGASTMMDVSLDTIQLPRRAATKIENRHSILKLPFVSATSDDLVIENESIKNIEHIFEDNPITISDVSVHYFAQRKSSIINSLGDDIGNEYLIDSNKAAVFNKQFINLERENSPLCISQMDDIDKTRLSLVETFASENTGDDEENGRSKNQSIEGLVVEDNCVPNRHIPVETCSLLLKEKDTKINIVMNKNHITLCRRCKHSQESFTSGSMSITGESFALPSMPPSPSLGMKYLKSLRNLPKLKDVHEYWKRRSLEKIFSNISPSSHLSFDSDYEKSSCYFKGILKDNYVFKKIEKQLSQLQFESIQTDISFKNLSRMISKTLPNWVFNYQTRARKQITFVHKYFFSFSVEMTYSDDSQLGNHISIQDVYLRNGRVASKYWKPIDHILDFNVKINLPVDLKLLLYSYNNEESVLKLLHHMDEACTNILEDARRLWRLVCKEEASLISYSNRVIVRKFIREAEEVADKFPFLTKTEFQIEINNIRTLSVKDIISPPLYVFSEELQYLPSGIDFLEIFLKSPCRYLK